MRVCTECKHNIDGTWPRMPEPIRRAMLALIETVTPE
jgi:hypothetical protein